MLVAKSESRRGTRILWAAVHTNEGHNPADVFPDRTAENLAGYLDRENAAGRHKSYHRICDDDSTVVYVPDSEAAWALPGGGNRPGLQLCFTGWARWDRAEWLRHEGMLLRGAEIVRGWCDAYGLPRVHLTPDQVAAEHRGVIGHVDWTRSRQGRGTHTDPGPNFPWDVFMALVNKEEGDMRDDERNALYDIREQLTGARSSKPPLYPGWPTEVGSLTVVDMLRRLVEEVAAERKTEVEGSDFAADIGRYVTLIDARTLRLERKLDELLERATDAELVPLGGVAERTDAEPA